MTRARIWFVVAAGIAFGLAVGHGADRGAPKADKGKWGRVTPIADTNHPNLYYDRGEIEELRQMMRVQHSPQHLWDRYKAEIRDAVAAKTIPDNKSPHHTNMKAALGYAIEPTTVKANAIRASLLSFISAFPNGLPGWYGTPGCYFSTDYTSGGYHFAQMSGAVLGAEMAYHNGMTGVFTLTDQGAEPALLRHWKRAIQSKTEIDRRPGNTLGHPIIGHSQELWAGYRRYADPAIEGAVSSLADSKTDEQELPSAVWEFFGHPRRIVWPDQKKQQRRRTQAR